MINISFIELFTNLVCGIGLLTCVDATHPTNVFNAFLINDEEKTFIIKSKRDRYDSSLLRKFFRLNNTTLYFQNINDLDDFFRIKLPYSASVRDVLKLPNGKLLAIGSLFPTLYEIDISSRKISTLPYRFDEFEYLSAIQVNNNIYITGFRINPKNGIPSSNGNVYKLNLCEGADNYCLSKTETKPINLYRSLALICEKDNNCIPVLKDIYDSTYSIKTLDDKELINIDCNNLSYSRSQTRRSLIPEKCFGQIDIKGFDFENKFSQRDFTLKVADNKENVNLRGKIYSSKNGEYFEILDTSFKNILLKKISSNNIYLMNQNEFSLLNLKLNKNLLIKDPKKSEIYHISGLKNKLYVSNTLVNNKIYSYDFKNKKGKSIKLEPLKNQENGQPQLIVPISDNSLFVINYPYSKIGLYSLFNSEGLLLKEWELNTSEKLDRPFDFLECPNKNILVVQKNSDYGLNDKRYYFEFPQKSDINDNKFIRKLSNIDISNIRNCNSIFYINNKSETNLNKFNNYYPNSITKGLTNRPITIRESKDNYLCIPLKYKVVCTKNNFYKKIITFSLKKFAK